MGSLVAGPRVVKGLYGTRRGAGPYGLTHRRLGGEGLLWVPPDGGTLWRSLGPPSATKASYGAGPGGPSPWGRRPRGGPFCSDSRLRSLFGWGGPIGSHSGGLPEGLVSWGLGGRVTAGNMEKLSSPGRGSGRRPPPNLLPPASHVRQVISPRGRRTPAGRRRARASPREGARRRREKAPGGSTTDPNEWKRPSTLHLQRRRGGRPAVFDPARGTFGKRGSGGGGHFLSTVPPLKARAAGARASPTSRRTDARSASSSTRASAMAAAGTFTRAWCATAATRSPSAPAARGRRPRPRGRDPTRQPVGARPPPIRALRRVAP